MKNLQKKFYREDTGEHVVEVVEDRVMVGVLIDRVLSGQGNAAGADHDHDEDVKIAEVDNKMAEPTNAAKTRY